MKNGEKNLRRNKKEIKIDIDKKLKEKINIERDSYKTYFEIIDTLGILHTYDIAEGVAAMMMCEHHIEDDIWNTKITEKDKKELNASKALYWLTGGNREWIESSNYIVEWFEASILFKKKYGRKITRIVRKANTLRDIKEKFEQNFNMSEFYEFALKNNLAE